MGVTGHDLVFGITKPAAPSSGRPASLLVGALQNVARVPSFSGKRRHRARFRGLGVELLYRCENGALWRRGESGEV